MEDDDEERFVRETELSHGSDRRFSQSTGLVSWAAAIFLTSVLEYIAEQVLQAAAHAADARARRQSKNPRGPMPSSGMVTPVDGLTVEVQDYDMEKVALNSALGRLWRTWRKSQRSNVNGSPLTPTTATSHNFSRILSKDPLSPGRSSFGMPAAESVSAMDESRRPSIAVNDKDVQMDDAEELPEAEYTEDVLAANIPLPLVNEKRDVDEIEVPGLAGDPDEAETEATQTQLRRRNSFASSAPQNFISRVLAKMGIAEDTDGPSDATSTTEKPVLTRQRSQSVPTQARSIFPLLEGSERTAAPPVVDSQSRSDQETEDQVEKAQSGLPDAKLALSSDAPIDAGKVEQEGTADDKSFADEAEDDPPFVEAEEYQTKDAVQPVGKLRVEEEPEAVGTSKPEEDLVPAEQPRPEEHARSDDSVATVKAVPTAEGSTPKTLEPEAETNAQETTAAQDESQEAESNPRKSLLENLAPGSAAAAEAAFLIVYGDKFSKKQARKSAPQASSIAEEEKDRQKQQVDMKRMSMPASAQGQPIQTIMEEPQLQDAGEPATVTRERSPTAESQQTFSLGSQDGVYGKRVSQQMYVAELAEKEDIEDIADIGVARTSDVRAEEVPVEHRHARDSYKNGFTPPRRQSRLILVGSPDSPTSSRRRDDAPVEQNESVSKTTPEGFLAERSLVSPQQSNLEHVKSKSSALQEQTRSPPGLSSHRASLPSALVVSKGRNSPPDQQKSPSPWRQSFSAATEKTAAWVSTPKKSSFNEQTSNVPVQEHPVVQRMASMKRTDKEDNKYPLTSASIRGPEDFEMFVQGGDTLKYTLTPENVRDEPVGVKDVGSSHAVQAQADAGAAQPRTSSNLERKASPSKNAQPLDMRKGRSTSIKEATAATPVPIPPEPVEDAFEPRKNADKRRSISRPPVRNTSVHRKSGLMAREPQVMTESTRDFADFIRSTGPTKEQEVQPILTSKSTTSLHSLGKARSSRSSSPGGASMRSLNRAMKRSETQPPVPAMPKTKSNMLPRAATSNGEGSSDLINFIRGGPSSDSPTEPGQKRKHRISRTIAPFRTTMDSDQLQEWGDRIAAQPDLKLNTAVAVAPSIQSASSIKSSSQRTSANSRSALLPSASTIDTAHPAYSGRPQSLAGNAVKTPTSAPAEQAPAVKRYRNKDPYAIDLDDEDDDFLTALPRGKREEESLIDFLRATGPSEKAGPAPSDVNGAGSQSAPPVIGPRRGSAPLLNTAGADAVSMGPRRGSLPQRDGAQTPSTTTSVPRTTGTTSIAIGPITKPRPKFEARPGSKPTENTTGDLADFLRSSGPVEPPAFARQSSKTSILSGSKNSEKKGRKSFFSTGFFAKKPQQTIGRAYLDM